MINRQNSIRLLLLNFFYIVPLLKHDKLDSNCSIKIQNCRSSVYWLLKVLPLTFLRENGLKKLSFLALIILLDDAPYLMQEIFATLRSYLQLGEKANFLDKFLSSKEI